MKSHLVVCNFILALSAVSFAAEKSQPKVMPSKLLSENMCAHQGKVTEVKAFSIKKRSLKMISKDWISEKFQEVLSQPGAFRWGEDKAAGKIYLERKDLGKDFYAPPIELGSCSAESDEGFTIMKCAASYLMYNGSHLLFVSVDDYAAPKALIHEQLKFNGQDALLVEVGIKGGSAWYVVPREFAKFEAVKCKEETHLEGD